MITTVIRGGNTTARSERTTYGKIKSKKKKIVDSVIKRYAAPCTPNVSPVHVHVRLSRAHRLGRMRRRRGRRTFAAVEKTRSTYTPSVAAEYGRTGRRRNRIVVVRNVAWCCSSEYSLVIRRRSGFFPRRRATTTAPRISTTNPIRIRLLFKLCSLAASHGIRVCPVVLRGSRRVDRIRSGLFFLSGASRVESGLDQAKKTYRGGVVYLDPVRGRVYRLLNWILPRITSVYARGFKNRTAYVECSICFEHFTHLD